MMMGFSVGSSSSSSPLHSSTYHSLTPSFSSSSHPFSFYSFHRKAHDFTKRRRIHACMQHHEPHQVDSCHRRAILFMGISVLPFLNLKAKALENLASHELENSPRAQELYQVAEVDGGASPNPFLTLSSGLGIIASGVLGAFYALAQKEKLADTATIESMKTKLAEREAASASMQKSFESKLQDEKEQRNEQIRKANQEKQSLLSQLSSANSTINGLGQELRKEKKVIEDLQNQIERLSNDLRKAFDEKEDLKMQVKDKVFSIEVLQERVNLLTSEIKDKEDHLANVRSALAAKETEFDKATSMYEETRAKLSSSKSEIDGLKQDIFKLEKELEVRSLSIDDLNGEIRSLCDKKDEISRELDQARKEYADLKLYSEQRADSDAELLEEKGRKLEDLKQQLESASIEEAKNKDLISKLTQERDGLRKMLDVEVGKVGNLEEEFRAAQKTLEDKRNEASELSGRLELSQNTCKELEAEVSRVQTEYSEAKDSLQKNIDKLKQTSEMLAYELTSTKGAYGKTKEELERVSIELSGVSENRDSLNKELVETYKKLESTINELKEERKTVTSLTKEVNALEAEILNDRESRKSMETDLEEVTRGLEEMKQNTMILSEELELSKTRISGLEDEKEALYRSIDEQKQTIQEARENMEDAHSIITKLGKEREGLEKKGGRLEKELAAAKGEILRLRSEMHSSKTAEKADEIGGEGSAEKVKLDGSEDGKVVKKVGRTRRKKVVSRQEES